MNDNSQPDHNYTLKLDSKTSVIQTTDSSTVQDLTLQRPCELKVTLDNGYLTSFVYHGHNPKEVVRLLEQQRQKRNLDLAINFSVIAVVFLVVYCLVSSGINYSQTLQREKVNYVN